MKNISLITGEISECAFVSAYSKKLKIQLNCSDPSRTKQSFRDECDVNQIMARYLQTGVLDFQQQYEPQYGDVPSDDFQASMEKVAHARQMFADMPAKLRDRFNNDPGRFLAFVQDDANLPEARLLGLVATTPPAPSTKPVTGPSNALPEAVKS
ncbi:MAG: internal scaffolding protein [Microvirus sp.]|nr:MAG: internal scaffolding protein [Microvirus sp.]